MEGVAATLGAALTPEQARLLHRFAPEVYIAYDGDRAGQKAILRGLEVLEGENVPVPGYWISPAGWTRMSLFVRRGWRRSRRSSPFQP